MTRQCANTKGLVQDPAGRVPFFLGLPELDLACVRQRRDRELSAYYVARSLDPGGTGVVDVSSLGLPISARSLVRVLRDGEGVFWTRDRSDLYLHRPGRVARAVGVDRLRDSYVASPRKLAQRSRAQLRGWLTFNAIAIQRDERPVAVATIAAKVGVSDRTVQSWRRATGWRVTANLCLLRPIDDPLVGQAIWRHVDQLGDQYRVRPSQLCSVWVDRRLWLAMRLPNSYRPGGHLVRKRATLARANRDLPPCESSGRGHRKIYVDRGERRRSHKLAYHFFGKLPNDIRLWTWGEPRSRKTGEVSGMKFRPRSGRATAGDGPHD